jgi:probable addiction module antidote protein
MTKKEKLNKEAELSDFNETVIERLKRNPKELESYKKFVFKDFSKNQDKELFLEGLKRIIAASNGISETAKSTKLTRASIYRMLDKNGNPTLDNFLKILKSLNVKFKIAA